MKTCSYLTYWALLIWLLVFLGLNVQAQPCIPEATYSCYFAYIDGVQLNSLSNTFTYCNGSANGFIEYPATDSLTTALQQGNSYPIILWGPQFEMVGFGIWLDLNNDGDFADSDEFLFSSEVLTGLQSGYLSVPGNAPTGEHRLRIRCNDFDSLASGESCDTFNYGETEDYTITIAQAGCFAGFTLVPDSLIPHHYWAINSAAGTPPFTYQWSWGDGTSDTAAYPGHTYDTAGYYTICLTINDAGGCTSTFCNVYYIQKSEEMQTIITVDVVDSISVTTNSNESLPPLRSFSVYPNPATENVFVNYSLASSATVKMELYDVLGNKLKEMSDVADVGEHRAVIITQALSNGVYYLEMRADEQMVSKKMVVLK